VSGSQASWSVPVHVITTSDDLLNGFIERGFKRELVPEPPALGGIYTRHWLLFSAIDSGERWR